MATKNIIVEHRVVESSKTCVIEPGHSQEFTGRTYWAFRPDELLLPGAGSLRLDSVRIADRTHVFGVPGERTETSGGIAAISLRAMPERAMHPAEDVYITLTNTGSSPARARPVLHGVDHVEDGRAPSYIPMHPIVVAREPQREFQIPSEKWLKSHPKGADASGECKLPPGVGLDHGCAQVIWRSPFLGRITKLRIGCKSDDMDLVGLKIGHPSQVCWHSLLPLPVELFRHGRAVRSDVVSVQQEVAFSFAHNTEAIDLVSVQIELEFQTISNPQVEALNKDD